VSDQICVGARPRHQTRVGRDDAADSWTHGHALTWRKLSSGFHKN
jgi:hypothetical protein